MSRFPVPGWPSGRSLMLAGAATAALGALIDRLAYEVSQDADHVRGLFAYSNARRVLTTAGGVLLAFGIALELGGSRE